jgi:hypothetical protein
VPTQAAPRPVDVPGRTRPSIPTQRTGSGSPAATRELTSRS